jgi:hypothetical protein
MQAEAVTLNLQKECKRFLVWKSELSARPVEDIHKASLTTPSGESMKQKRCSNCGRQHDASTCKFKDTWCDRCDKAQLQLKTFTGELLQNVGEASVLPRPRCQEFYLWWSSSPCKELAFSISS